MENWLNHPGLKNIDPAKLELMKNAVSQTQGKSGRTLAPILMALITSANKKGIRFTPDEVGLIMELMKEGKSAAEKEQMDRTVQMAESFLKKHR